MTTFNLSLMAIFYGLFYSLIITVEASLIEDPGCYEYSYGPCIIKVEQRADPNDNGLSIILDVSVNSTGTSQCVQQKPDDPAYVELPGYGYYKYHDTPMTWFQAWDVCKIEGGHLTVFNSQEEAEFVGNIPVNQYDWAFIGFHDLFEEGNYVTVFDQSLQEAGWSTWEASNPNGGTTENCGVTFRSGELGDYVCDDPRTFFCEISCQTV